MPRNQKYLSLPGTIAIAHLVELLLIIAYHRSFAGPDNRHLVNFLEMVWIVHIFPLGWFANLLHPSSEDIVLTAILIAANSVLIGFVLAWIVRHASSFLSAKPSTPPAARAG